MSVGPCDWMDAVLEGAARNGAPYKPTDPTAEWCDTDDFELSVDHIVRLFRERNALLEACRAALALLQNPDAEAPDADRVTAQLASALQGVQS